MDKKIKELTRREVTESVILGPTIKTQLLATLHNLDDEKLSSLVQLLRQAETARERFGQTSQRYREVLDAIEASAMRAAEHEADRIFAEFEAELEAMDR